MSSTEIRLRNEEDMLRGNLNRMFLSDDTEEINQMAEIAHKRINEILRLRLEEIEKEGKYYG